MSNKAYGWSRIINRITREAEENGRVIFEEYCNGIGAALDPKLDLVVDFALRGADKSRYAQVGFKFYDPHYLDTLVCRDYQYYEGQAHTLPDLSKLHMCRTGFHFCDTIDGCSNFYPFTAAPVTPVLGRYVIGERIMGRFAKYCAGELYVGRRLSDMFKYLWSIKELVYDIRTYHNTDDFLALTTRRDLLANELDIRAEYRDECLKLIAALDEKAILVLCVEEYWREFLLLYRMHAGISLTTTFKETAKFITTICEEVYDKHCKEEFEAFIKEEKVNEKR